MNRNELVGDRIVSARELRAVKAKDLADKLGISTSRLSNWENGTSGVSAEYIFKISEILEVTSDYLIGLDDTPQNLATTAVTTGKPSNRSKPLIYQRFKKIFGSFFGLGYTNCTNLLSHIWYICQLDFVPHVVQYK